MKDCLLTKPQLLVVDDEERNRRLIRGMLQSEGYEVREAADGESALAMAREITPDLVLLDVMMPGMTGHEVCKVLKDQSRTRLSQVMLVTALDGTPDKVTGLDCGADDYVTKPVRREEFLAKVRALLRARSLLLDLETARAELAERNAELELKKTLAQTLVHDLKNPLSAVLGNLDLLEMRAEEKLEPLIQRSKDGARRMLKMILNLMDVESLEAGRFEPDLAATDAADVVERAVEESRVTAATRKVEIALEAAAECKALADTLLLRRVVDNLISNAIQHSPVGTTVHVGVRPDEHGVRIDVEDQGPGIPEELRSRVFEKYATSSIRESGVMANRGLGLTFCQLAVEAQGGTIWVDEGAGGGAQLCVILPAHFDEERSGPGKYAMTA